MAWNGRYQLYSKELEKVIKKGSGSNADLNFILISILKDFGLEAYPVVMSRRSSGMLAVQLSFSAKTKYVLCCYPRI